LSRWNDSSERTPALQEQLDEKNQLLLQHQENWAAVRGSQPTAPEEADEEQEEPESASTWGEVAELVQILEDSDAFVLTDQARGQLTDNPYPDPERMWEHLERLANAAEAFHEADGEIGQRFEDWVVENGFKLDISLHDEGLSRSGADQFEFEDTTYSREPHVKVDDYVDPASCGRIYFALDSANGRIIVDHVGLHL
jgi:hypothetical protein